MQHPRYTDKRIELLIVFRHTISSSRNRLRSDSRILVDSGNVEARTLSGQHEGGSVPGERHNVPENRVGASPLSQAGAPEEAPAPTKLSDLTVFPKAL